MYFRNPLFSFRIRALSHFVSLGSNAIAVSSPPILQYQVYHISEKRISCVWAPPHICEYGPSRVNDHVDCLRSCQRHCGYEGRRFLPKRKALVDSVARKRRQAARGAVPPQSRVLPRRLSRRDRHRRPKALAPLSRHRSASSDHGASDQPDGCAPDDQAPRRRRRPPLFNVLPHVPSYGYYGFPRKWRNCRERSGDRGARVAANDQIV